MTPDYCQIGRPPSSTPWKRENRPKPNGSGSPYKNTHYISYIKIICFLEISTTQQLFTVSNAGPTGLEHGPCFGLQDMAIRRNGLHTRAFYIQLRGGETAFSSFASKKMRHVWFSFFPRRFRGRVSRSFRVFPFRFVLGESIRGVFSGEEDHIRPVRGSENSGGPDSPGEVSTTYDWRDWPVMQRAIDRLRLRTFTLIHPALLTHRRESSKQLDPEHI